MKIAVIICYLGEFPWFFRYFLHSCKTNTLVDFFIITDNNFSKENIPSNVYFIYKSMLEINALAENKLGFETNIKSGYKICDFKPAYGFIFNEVVCGYDYWGHGDIDVIYGNIRNFITEEIMKTHDLISVRPDWTPGCFLLFKNSEKMNLLFMQSRDYRKIFSDSRHYCFDETNFQHNAFSEGKKYYEIPSEIESMMHVIRRLEANGIIKAYFDLHIIEGRPGRLKWDNGVLTYKNEYEAILYHLIKLKDVYSPKEIPRKIPNTFYISQNRIYS